MTREELREKVAHMHRIVYATEADRRIAADAAIALVLEEAAKVADKDAESCAANVWVFSPPMAGANTEARLLHEGGQQIAESIAAAIRALGKEEK